jgi:hypothetical protein
VAPTIQTNFASLIPLLSAHRPVIAIDEEGHGRTALALAMQHAARVRRLIAAPTFFFVPVRPQRRDGCG